MESEWRMNIPLFGMVGQGFELAARLATPLPPFYNYLLKAVGSQNVFYGRLADEQLLTYTGGAPPPADHPHFPWGIDVFPD